MDINPPTGQMNLQTTEYMVRKRCSNPDIEQNHFKRNKKKKLGLFYNFRFT